MPKRNPNPSMSFSGNLRQETLSKLRTGSSWESPTSAMWKLTRLLTKCKPT